jgi:hypothetical protein
MILEVAYHALTASEAITNLVGEAVYYNQGPQDAPAPCIILQSVSDPITWSMVKRVRSQIATFRANCYGASETQSKDLARLVANVLAGVQGEQAAAGALVSWVRPFDITPIPSVTPDGSETAHTGYVVDVRAFYRAS